MESTLPLHLTEFALAAFVRLWGALSARFAPPAAGVDIHEMERRAAREAAEAAALRAGFRAGGGHDSLVARLVARVEAGAPVTALVGAAGSGVTSVLSTLAVRLAADAGVEAVVLFRMPWHSAGDAWQFLCRALGGAGRSLPAFAGVVASCAARAGGAARRTVLLIDGLEPEASRGACDAVQRAGGGRVAAVVAAPVAPADWVEVEEVPPLAGEDRRLAVRAVAARLGVALANADVASLEAKAGAAAPRYLEYALHTARLRGGLGGAAACVAALPERVPALLAGDGGLLCALERAHGEALARHLWLWLGAVPTGLSLADVTEHFTESAQVTRRGLGPFGPGLAPAPSAAAVRAALRDIAAVAGEGRWAGAQTACWGVWCPQLREALWTRYGHVGSPTAEAWGAAAEAADAAAERDTDAAALATCAAMAAAFPSADRRRTVREWLEAEAQLSSPARRLHSIALRDAARRCGKLHNSPVVATARGAIEAAAALEFEKDVEKMLAHLRRCLPAALPLRCACHV